MTRDGAAVYKPINPATGSTFPDGKEGFSTGPPVQGVNIAAGELLKKKRGRPRKCISEGSMGCFSPLFMGHANMGLSVSGDAVKKAKGRSLGSGNKIRLLQLGSTETGFIPHVITVTAGEDISAKIMSFSHHGPRAICVLSANGAISNATLRQAASSGGTVTYEGRFEILSLSGSFLLSENSGPCSRTGGLSVSLASPDGRIVGGGVEGLLTAASPVQVVVASFIAEGKKERKLANLLDGTSTMEKLVPTGGVITGGTSPHSRGTLSESSGEKPSSPLAQSNQQSFSNVLWK